MMSLSGDKSGEEQNNKKLLILTRKVAVLKLLQSFAFYHQTV